MTIEPEEPSSAATQRLLGQVIAELAERYQELLPVQAIAEVVHAAYQATVAERPAGPDDPTAVAEATSARARAELAMAVGLPARETPYQVTPGLATAWTHLLDGVAVVRAVGEFDMRTAEVLRQELARAVGADRATVLLDLARVSFMDLAGLSVLREAARNARRRARRLILVQVPAHVDRLIEAADVAAELYGPAEPSSAAGADGADGRP